VGALEVGELRCVTTSATDRSERADANRFFQLINRRYTRSSTIVTSNKRPTEWAELFGDEVLAAAILDRLLHDAEVLTINGPSWRLRGHGDILERPTDAAKERGTGDSCCGLP
jgi:IstB-like ATP binding protein